MLKGMKNHLKKLLKGEIPLSDVYYYFQGHLREKLYYSKCKFLIRKHIQEQFEFILTKYKNKKEELVQMN